MQVSEAKLWVTNSAKELKSGIINHTGPVALQSVASGGMNAFCAKLFTSVPPIGIGVFVANATAVNRIANVVFPHDHEKFADGEPRATLYFAVRTIATIYVPHAMTQALGYNVNPSDCLKVGLITMAAVSLTVMTAALAANALIGKAGPEKRLLR